MYRAEFLWNNIDKLIPDEDVFPICVPSYNRPAAPLLKYADQLPIYLFIRKEQEADYAQYKGKVRGIIKLTGVEEIGMTRAMIVKWAQTKGHDNIFMMDDDVTALHFLVPWSNGDKQYMKRWTTVNDLPESVDLKIFKMWMYMISRCDERLTLSGPGNISDWWNISNKDSLTLYNSSSTLVCVHLNIKNMMVAGIDYIDTRIGGTEDYTLQYQVMISGLYSAVFKDIAFRVPNVGAGNAIEQQRIVEKYHENISLFQENIMRPDDADRVGVKVSKSGVPSIKFNWSRWRAPETMMYTCQDISDDLKMKGVM